MWLGTVGLLRRNCGMLKVRTPIHDVAIRAVVFDTRSIGEVVRELAGHKDSQWCQSFRVIELEIKKT